MSCDKNVEIRAPLFDVLGAGSDYELGVETQIPPDISLIFTVIIVDVGTR
jgi:hypothetical protein